MSLRLFAYLDARGPGIAYQSSETAEPCPLGGSLDLRDALLGMTTRSLVVPASRTRTLAPGWRWRLPIRQPGKILAVAQNYAKHAAEMGAGARPEPREPVFFAKLAASLVPHLAPIVIPEHLAGTRIDHEGELAVVIGRPGRNLDPSDAMAIVAGFTIANDVTARDLQATAKKLGQPWLWAKSQDTFCPLGPVVVPIGHLDPSDLELVVTVNGAVRQRASTRDMTWKVPELIAAASRHTSLEPGDILLTGTPEGVGPIVPGDTVAVTIAGIGTLENPVVASA